MGEYTPQYTRHGWFVDLGEMMNSWTTLKKRSGVLSVQETRKLCCRVYRPVPFLNSVLRKEPLVNAVDIGREYDLLRHPFKMGETLLGDNLATRSYVVTCCGFSDDAVHSIIRSYMSLALSRAWATKSSRLDEGSNIPRAIPGWDADRWPTSISSVW